MEQKIELREFYMTTLQWKGGRIYGLLSDDRGEMAQAAAEDDSAYVVRWSWKTI